MKTKTFCVYFVLFITAVAIAPAALAQQIGQIDDFEDGSTQGWMEGGGSSNQPTNISSGGPAGNNDNYLRNISSGSSGSGGKMVMFNRAQWMGDYNAAEITSLRMWLRNQGNTAMQIRIALRAGSTWFASTNGFALPADNVWRQTTFDLDTDSLTRVEGQLSLATVLGAVAELRILSANAPHFRGAQISATLGVDNIEALGAAPVEPWEFEDLVSLADTDGNNNTDVGVLRIDPDTGKHIFSVLDGFFGNEITSVSFGTEAFEAASVVTDANGDQIPEYGVLVRSSLFARVKDVVNNTLIGKPRFPKTYTPIALLGVGEAGGSAGPDVAMVGLEEGTGKVQAWVKEAASGLRVSRMSFSKAFAPFGAVAVDNVGGGNAMEIAVLGVDATGKVQATVKDAGTGALVAKVAFSRKFTPLFFAAVPDANGDLTNLAVLGEDATGVIQAQVKRAVDGSKVSNVKFSKKYVPMAFFGHIDSDASGSGEITVVGVDVNGGVRAQTREIADGTLLSNIDFDSNYPPLAAIGMRNAAGIERNEIALVGQHANGIQRLTVMDLLDGFAYVDANLP